MSNLQASIRYRVIDRCLRNRTRKWNWQSLAEECVKELVDAGHEVESLSERTIKGDISAMKNDSGLGYFAPIIFDRSNGMENATYLYLNPSYSISETLLNPEDVSHLSNMMSIVRQDTNLGSLAKMDSIFEKLALIVSESPDPVIPIFQLEQASYVAGKEWLDKLYNYIYDKKTLTITYRKFNNEPRSYIVSPYFLKEYQNRWFLFAWNHRTNEIRTFGLERIEHLSDSFAPYHPNEIFKPDEYFKDIIGISRMAGVEKEEIIFRVFDDQRHYVKTKPLHSSQSLIRKTDSYSDYSINVIPNRELEMAILAIGENIEIIEPRDLRDTMTSRVKKLAERYHTP